jgi:hypothetical protein
MLVLIFLAGIKKKIVIIFSTIFYYFAVTIRNIFYMG